MTTITATAVPGGSAAPAGFQIDVAAAPIKPTSVYASNFSAGTDSWSVFGTAGAMGYDTTTTPPTLLLTGPTASLGEVHVARTVTGLTIGATYRLSARITQGEGQCKLAVRNGSEGTEFATGSYTKPLAARTPVELEFTATATSHVIEIFTRTPFARAATLATLRADTVRVDPVTWLGTSITRTDANGDDVPVRNPLGVDTEGFAGFTLMDYEAALIGPVTYNVVDGLGGTATCTATASPSRSNRATNPIGSGVASVSPWAGIGGTLAVHAADHLRLTLTSATLTDLAQNVASPVGGTADAFTLGELVAGDPVRAIAQGRCSLAPIAGATITVRQALVGTQGTMATSDTSLNVSTLPVTGNVVVVYCQSFEAASTLTGMSGLGATWARITPAWAAGGNHATEWWIGTGANATGNITVTRSASKTAVLRAWLIGGLTSNSAAITQQKIVSTGTTFTGTAVNAQSGQIVLQAAATGTSSGATYPNPHAPTTGWTVGTMKTDAILGSVNTAYRIPTELVPTSHNATITSSGGTNLWVENLVLGVAVTPSTPVPKLKSRLTFYDSGASSIEAHESAIVTVNDTVFSDLTIDTVVPSGAVYARLQVGIEGTVTRQVGDWFDVRRAAIGNLETYFDGDTGDTDTERFEWSGTADASASLAIDLTPTAADAPSLTIPTTALLVTNLTPPEFAELTMMLAYEETSQTNGTVHTVIGRADRISNPGPLTARAGTFDLFCLDYAAANDVRTLLESSLPAMLRQGSFEGFDLYFVARSVTLRPEPTDSQTRRWAVTVAYDEVPRP